VLEYLHHKWLLQSLVTLPKAKSKAEHMNDDRLQEEAVALHGKQNKADKKVELSEQADEPVEQADQQVELPNLECVVISLLESEWPERWTLLASDSRLIDSSIVIKLKDEDRLLSDVIQRLIELQGHSEQLRCEFELLYPLVARLANSQTENLAGSSLVADAKTVSQITGIWNDGQFWAADYLQAVIKRIAPEAQEPFLQQLQTVYLQIVAMQSKQEPARIEQAIKLAGQSTDEILDLLEGSSTVELEDFLLAAKAAKDWLDLCDPDEIKLQAIWLLTMLLTAAIERGFQACKQEANVYSDAVDLTQKVSQNPDERLHQLCSFVTNTIPAIIRTGAVWLLPIGISMGREAYSLFDPSHPDYPVLTTCLSTLITEAIKAGCVDNSFYTEAINYQRAALQTIGTANINYPRYANDFSTLVDEATYEEAIDTGTYIEAIEYQRLALTAIDHVNPGYLDCLYTLGKLLYAAAKDEVIDQMAYLEAIDYLRIALDASTPSHPDYPDYAYYLSLVLADSVLAGLLDASYLKEAVNCQRLAVKTDDPTNLGYIWRVNTYMGVLTQAILAGVIDKSAYEEVLEYERLALSLMDHSSPEYADCCSNLGKFISKSIQRGILDKSALLEAIEYQRIAVDITDTTNPGYPMLASNLAVRLTEALQARIIDKLSYSEVLDYQRQAVLLSSPYSPGYTQYIDRLGAQLALAVQAGVVDRSAYAQVLEYHRIAVKLTDPEHPYYEMYTSNLSNALQLESNRE
jgi:tetratricopeptide (TPR) repeat protein